MLVTGEAGMDDLSGPVGIVSTITQVGTASETIGGRGGEHPLLRGHAGGESGGDESAAHPCPGRRQDLLPALSTQIAMKLFRKKIPEKYETAVNTAGFVAC